MTRPIIVQTETLEDNAAAWLAARCDVVRAAPGERAFDDAIESAAGLIVRTYTIVDDALLARGPKLRVVGRAGVGVDNIDLDACAARNVEVVYTPDANTQAVVEYVIRIMAGALRPLKPVDQSLSVDQWRRIRSRIEATRQLDELTLGILGLGRIGSRVSAVAGAIGMVTIYNDVCDRPLEVRHGAKAVDVEELFARSDVLTIHIDGRQSNRGFVNESLLERMREDVTLINTSRGMVLDAGALAAFLRTRPLATAHLDVHEPEPFDDSYPLLGVDNAVLYPHLASRTKTAMANMSWVVRDVWGVLAGEQPRFPARGA